VEPHEAMSDERFVFMTDVEAYARYQKWWAERESGEPLYTYAGWLQHKGIRIKEEPWK
jgi:hypothetical protein